MAGDGETSGVRKDSDDERIEPDALDRLYRSEAPRIARFFRLRLRGHEEVADLVQEAFARLAGSRTGAALRNPEGYLQGIVRHLLLDRFRDPKRKVRHVEIGDHPELVALADQSYAIEAEDMKRQYRAAVDALPPRMREVFLLRRVDGLDHKQIAERLKISVRTVEWHIAEALIRIDKAVDRS